MAVTETNVKNAVTMKLNNGVDSQGNIKTVDVSIGTLSTTGSDYDKDKAFAIVNALTSCLSKTLYNTQHTATYDMSSSG